MSLRRDVHIPFARRNGRPGLPWLAHTRTHRTVHTAASGIRLVYDQSRGCCARKGRHGTQKTADGDLRGDASRWNTATRDGLRRWGGPAWIHKVKQASGRWASRSGADRGGGHQDGGEQSSRRPACMEWRSQAYREGVDGGGTERERKGCGWVREREREAVPMTRTRRGRAPIRLLLSIATRSLALRHYVLVLRHGQSPSIHLGDAHPRLLRHLPPRAPIGSVSGAARLEARAGRMQLELLLPHCLCPARLPDLCTRGARHGLRQR